MKPVEVLPDLFALQRGWPNANHRAAPATPPVLVGSACAEVFPETERRLEAMGVGDETVEMIVTAHGFPQNRRPLPRRSVSPPVR